MTDFPKRPVDRKAETKKESSQHAPRRPQNLLQTQNSRRRPVAQDRRRKPPSDRIRFAIKSAPDDEGEHTASGKTAKVVRLLLQRGAQGLTQHDTYPWHTRLAATVENLRKRGLNIQTLMEPHSDGRHARYVLLDTILIIEDLPDGEH